MSRIQVPDMMCQNCVRRIEEALSAQGLSFQVSLEEKAVDVDGGPEALTAASERLEQLGFTPQRPAGA